MKFETMPRRKTISGFEEDKYEVLLEFQRPLLGSVPADSGAIQYWLRARTERLYGFKEALRKLPEVTAEFQKHLENYNRVASARMGELEEEGESEAKTYSILLFLRRPDAKDLTKGAVIEQYHIAGLLKDAAIMLGASRSVTRIGDRVRTFPFDIPIYADKECTEEAKILFPYVRYIRGMTMRGPRSAVLFHEWIEPPAYAKFELHTFGIPEETVKTLFRYAEQYLGILAGRHHEAGRFKILKLEKVE